MFFTIILPLTCNILSVKGFAHTVLATWLAGNVFFNYYYCITTDPGSPPDQLDLAESSATSCDRLNKGVVRWCKKCRKPKPLLTHHCHVCDRCVLKMDHHCPWMHNCIGFHNYRYFFLFLAYMWIGCGYAVVMSAYPLFLPPPGIALEPQIGVLFTFVLSCAMVFALSVLFGWHVYLVGTAQTTIDFYGNRQRMREAQRTGQVWENEFNLGFKRNYLNTFELSGGRWWWLVLLMPRNTTMKGDGIYFQTREDGYNQTTNASSFSDGSSDNSNHGRKGSHSHSGTDNVISGEVITATSTTTRSGGQSRERSVNELGRVGPDLV